VRPVRPRYHQCIVVIHPRHFTPAGCTRLGCGEITAYEKGWGDWRPAAHNVVSLREFTDTTGAKHTLANLERPQLLFDAAGHPIALFAAAGEQDPFKGTPSFNLHFAIKPAPSAP
jgi:hypothetical protein